MGFGVSFGVEFVLCFYFIWVRGTNRQLYVVDLERDRWFRGLTCYFWAVFEVLFFLGGERVRAGCTFPSWTSNFSGGSVWNPTHGAVKLRHEWGTRGDG
jgi:hypothetical protein